MAGTRPGRGTGSGDVRGAERPGVPRDEEAALNPQDAGTLSSGYSRQSANGGTPGDAMRQAGLPEGNGDVSDDAAQRDHDALAHAGATPGAAGEDVERAKVESRERASGRVAAHDEDESMDGAASVLGVSGVSGGTSGTTRIDNTRK